MIAIAIMLMLPVAGRSQQNLLWSRSFETGYYDQSLRYPNVSIEDSTIVVDCIDYTTIGDQIVKAKYDFSGNQLSFAYIGNPPSMASNIVDYLYDESGNLYQLLKNPISMWRFEAIIQKYSPTGMMLWQQNIIPESWITLNPYHLFQSNDTSILVIYSANDETGLYYNQSRVNAIHTEGSLMWELHLDQSNEMVAIHTRPIQNGDETLLLGINNNNENKIAGLNFSGEIIRNVNFEGPETISHAMLFNSDHLIVTSADYYELYKIRLDGQLIWSDCYGTNLPPNFLPDKINSLFLNGYGNIFITGKHHGTGFNTPDFPNADALSLKYNSLGWRRGESRYQYGQNNIDIGNYICVANGNIYVAGKSQSDGEGSDYDLFIQKIDPYDWSTSGIYRYNGSAEGNEDCASISVLPDGRVALTGWSFNGTTYDVVIQFLDDIILSSNQAIAWKNTTLHPNPTTGTITVTLADQSQQSTLTLTDRTGKTLRKWDINQPVSQLHLDDLPKGVYLMVMTTKGSVSVEKIVLL
ncbi:MAG: T9SS type A sorting domain-containing protein [Bacteroidales bacterium]|nr:T9SS type A sorting domain-containing protein [Bacteroidales bacterium]MDD3666719.1 T9SS type A sorting domain-containing protein [Bacteroidales bacterium]